MIKVPKLVPEPRMDNDLYPCVFHSHRYLGSVHYGRPRRYRRSLRRLANVLLEE